MAGVVLGLLLLLGDSFITAIPIDSVCTAVPTAKGTLLYNLLPPSRSPLPPPTTY